MSREGERLAAWAEAVRASTLKRLRRVPRGCENWRPDPEAMSFADLALHVARSDAYFFEVIDVIDGRRAEPDVEGVRGPDRSRDEYDALVEDLARLGEERRQRLAALGGSAFDGAVHDPRFGATTLWWVVVRGCLDHETHHRGQIAAQLRACLAEGAVSAPPSPSRPRDQGPPTRDPS
jgi:uncharacterized damage-inducible protein DinB